MKRKILTLFLLLLYVSCVLASTPKDWTWWNTMANWDQVTPWQHYLRCSPKFFGPNAFPVPKMGDARISDKLIVNVSFDQYWGFGDNTTDMNLRLDIPLLPKYVSLSLWMIPIEYYNTSIHVRNERFARTEIPKGFAVGDVYIQTGIQLLRDRPKAPDLMINLSMKTASGSPLIAVRYYDTPGYFFDATIGKTFQFDSLQLLQSLSFSAKIGFLCWQSLDPFQDDAVLYGLKINFATRKWYYEMDWSGYAGYGVIEGDKPMVLRAQIMRNFKKGHSIYVNGLIGLHDYPYYSFSLGYQFSYPVHLFKKKQH